MRLIGGTHDSADGQRIAEYVGQQCDTKFTPPYSAIGSETGGKLVNGVVFNSYTPFDIELTIAAERGAYHRATFKRIGEFVFAELGCLRMSFTTQQAHVVDLIHRLGGQTEGRKRNHFGAGQDGIVLGILREDWKIR